MICRKCGTEIADDSKFCAVCGTAFEQLDYQPIASQTYYQEAPKKEISVEDLPDHLQPMGAWSYFGLQILFLIPIVGLVFLIVFSFSSGNLSRRSFARSYWCWVLIISIIFCISLLFSAILGYSTARYLYF